MVLSTTFLNTVKSSSHTSEQLHGKQQHTVTLTLTLTLTSQQLHGKQRHNLTLNLTLTLTSEQLHGKLRHTATFSGGNADCLLGSTSTATVAAPRRSLA